MSDESCPLPTPPTSDQRDAVRRMLSARRVAVVGLSDDPRRVSHQIGSYLRSVGKEVIPVNPNHAEVFGLKCYPSLQAVPGEIDLVNVFRRSEFAAGVVRDAIASKAKGVWLQVGVVSDQAKQLAEEAGLDFIQDRCIMVMHMQQG